MSQPVAPAQITLCGVLKPETVAAIVELAIAAGAGLVVQPRPVTPSAPLLLAGEVVEPSTPRRARAAVVVKTKRHGHMRAEPEADVLRRVEKVLRRDGPLAVKDFLARTGLTVWQGRELVARGVLVATGATQSRKYSLPGAPAKEAP